MNSFRIKDLRFRILKGGKIGLTASLMFFGVMANFANATTVMDGSGGTGIFVGNIYGAGSNQTYGNSSDTTVFTNYYTEGGAGSGGGAGLGGVFFVDKGSSLTLTNTKFQFNTSKGGEGGSLPSQAIENTTININQLTLGLTGYEQLSINPTLTYSNGVYSFSEIKIGTGTDLLKSGSNITFSELSGASGATISAVTKTSVTLSSALTINSSDIETINNASNIFNVSGKVVTLSTPNDQSIIDQVKDNIKYGGQIAFRDGSTVVTKTVASVSYNSDGNIKSFELDSNVSGLTVGSSTNLDIMPISKFETKPYSISGNTITVTGTMRGFKTGMILYDGDGNSTGAKITNVQELNGVYTLSVDSATSALTDAKSITAKSSPFISNTQIQLSAPNSDLIGASSVNINGTNYSIFSYNNTTGIVTLASSISSTLKSDVEVDGDLLTLKVNTISLSGNNITLLDKGQNFATGMKIEGTNLKILAVSKSNGNIILLLDGDTSAITDTSKISAVDTLTTGGSMNNLSALQSSGTNGKNGKSMNEVSSASAGGEGQRGTNGYTALDGLGASGGNGGNGGNGSDGLPVNPQLTINFATNAYGLYSAISRLASDAAPDGAIPAPDYANLPTDTTDVAKAAAMLALSTAELTKWALNLKDGIAGLGGAGGNGGNGGNGDTFFGGGSGGSGGNGGEGALDYTDGGTGGTGGTGGAGGFGSGGGAGGAGGIAGSTGAAADGTPGIGGVAGFGAGDGSNGDGLYGDGGSGFGGAVFVRKDGTLNITGNSLFENNSVMAGSSNNGGSAGESAGTALFMMKDSTVNLMPGSGNKIIFNDTIADDSKSSYYSASYASGAGADIHIQGNGGLVEFNGVNTYSGETYLEGGTLNATLGVGINDNSRIVFNGASTSSATNSTSYTDNLNLGTVGTLLLSENLDNRRVGNRSIDISWEGSGGFASKITNGIIVNLGKISGTTIGQQLTWGSNGFFESAALNKTLTFGSELSLGSVDFQNSVNIGSNIARVAVYNTNLVNNTNSSSAILSGNWIGNELMVGEADYYNGNLILTGNNKLNKLTILDGITTTIGSGKISDSNTAKTIVKMYGGKLILSNNETLNSASINQGALFVSNANLTVDNTITNSGQVIINTGIFNNDIINDGQLANGGNLTVNASIINDSIPALWNQIGTILAENITNNGTWQNQSNVTISTAFVNNGTWYSGQQQVVNNVASWVAYPESTKNVVTTSTLTGTGTFDVSNGDLEIKQTGNSIFAGTTTGQGSLTKSDVGTLQISNAQTFTGGLNVTGGTFETVSGGTLLDPKYGTLADTNAVHVFKNSTFIAGVVDTVGSVLVDAAASGSVGTFTMNANITTKGNFENNGQLNLNANLNTANTDASDSTNGDFINNGTTTLTADRTVTTAGGLVGATTGIINVNNSGTNLTLNQSGNTTYSGTIVGVGSFIKTGNGNLTLNGVANSIDLGTTDSSTSTFVNAGTLTTASQNVFAADQDITVANGATLHVKTGSQNVDTITNSGIVNLDDNLIVRILTNNVDGTFNQQANITSINAIMNGNWNVEGYGVSDYTRVLNTVTLTGDANVTLVDYIDGTTTTASHLKINQSGNSIFDGSIAGNGSVEKIGLGKLSITDAQTFTGGLNVTGGTFETVSGGTLDPTYGTLADTNAVHVFKNSTFIAGVVDTVASVLVDAVGTGTTAGRFDMNANITTLGNFTNNGTLELNANLTTGDTNSSNGTNNNFVNNGTTNLTANRTITTEGGLSGLGRINITNLSQNSNTTLTLNQLGDTTYSGKILGAGSFTKTGNGNLILNGTANSVNLGGTLTIANGKLGLDGAGILNSNLDVIVSTAGELDLISGNQEILALGGQGLIDLGTNTLNVTAGGTFTGTVVGSGTLHIGDGDFTVNNNITSQNGTFDVGTTTSNNTGTTTTTTTINETATLTFPDINVKSDGKLDLKGTAESNTVTVFQGGILHLGDPLSNTDNAKIATLATSIYGIMSGTGTVLGNTTVKSGGSIKPGDSPGQITFANLTLNNGSTTDMEINDSGVAGVNFDQINVTNKFAIDSGSTLNIIKYNGGILPVATELSMGEKIKAFNFNPGSVSGKFDTINSTYTNDVLFNVASGEVIGLGGVSANQFQNTVAQTQNQQSMLKDLNVDNSGNVEQFYGGNLVSRLANAYGNTNETNKIFALASPEIYAGLMDQTRLGLTSSSVDLPINFKEAKDGLTANTNFDSKSTSNSSEWAEYDMKNNSLKLEYTHVTKDTILAVSLTQNDRKISSNFMSSNTNGYDVSVGIAKEILEPGLSLRGSIGYMKDESDVTRQTYTTESNVKDINSDGIITGLGLGYTKDYKSLTFDFSADALYYKANVESFVENNVNNLDSLTVDKQTKDGMAYKAKAGMSSKVTENLQLQTGVNVLFMPNSDNFDIKAKVSSEETWFNVENPGIGQTSFGLDAGAKYKIKDNMSISLDAGVNEVDKSNVGYNSNLSFIYNF